LAIQSLAAFSAFFGTIAIYFYFLYNKFLKNNLENDYLIAKLGGVNV